jgi:hypothetical protein
MEFTLIRCCTISVFCIAISLAFFAFAQEPRSIRNFGQRAPLPAEIEEDLLSREEQVIFGLIVLNRRHSTLRDDGYAYYLRELLKSTDYSATEAVEIVNKYKNNPEKWLAVLERLRSSLISAGMEKYE